MATTQEENATQEETAGRPSVTRSWFGRAALGGAVSFAFVAVVIWLSPAGARTAGVWALAFGGGSALFAWLFTAGSRWSRVGRWSALAACGQGAALSWIDAGPGIHFQHLRISVAPWGAVALLAAGVLGLQGLALLSAGRPALRRAAVFVREQGTALRWLAVLGLFVLTGAALSREPMFYVAELIGSATLQTLALGVLIAASLSLTPDQAKSVERVALRLLANPRLPLLVAVWVFLASAALAGFAYQFHPHVPDEVVYLLQARYFAEGLLDMPLPPVPAAFDMDLTTYETARWYVPVPPGWPAALAVGVRAGVPWLVNPLLGGVTVLLVHSFIKDIYGPRTAGAVTCLLGLSPWFLFLNMSLMTHSFTLFAAAVGAVAASRRVRGGGWAWAVLSGCGIGLVALNRPLEGLIAAAGLGLWVLLDRGEGGRTWVGRFGDVSIMAFFSAAVVATTLPYNAHFTGDALVFPIMAYADQIYGEGTNALGFGPGKGLGFGGLDPFPGHGIGDVAVNSALNLFQINVELSGWSVGSILPIALLILVSGGVLAADLGMVGAIVLVMFAHAFYWFSGGPDFGARYWYLALVPLLVLVTQSLKRLGHLSEARGRVVFATALLCATSLSIYLPWRATDKYWHYRDMEPGILNLATEHDWGPDDIVIVRGDRVPDYASVATYNPINLVGDGPLYAWDGGPEVERALIDAFPRRRYWWVDGPTVTGASFRVREGPRSFDGAR